MAKVRTHHAWAPEPGVRRHSDGLYIGTDLFGTSGSTLMTKALVPLPPGDSVAIAYDPDTRKNVCFHSWNPFNSPLAAAVLAGLSLAIKPTGSVLMLCAIPSDVARASDIIGLNGVVHAVEPRLEHREELIKIAASRPNVVPVFEALDQPDSYVVWPLATVLYAQIASPRQTELVAAIAARHLVHSGSFTMLISVFDMAAEDSNTPEEQVFHRELVRCRQHSLRPVEQITLQPFFQRTAVLRGVYEKRPAELAKETCKRRLS